MRPKRGGRPGASAAKRVGEDIRMKLAQLMLRELRDPRLAGIYLTRVEMSPDLTLARGSHSPRIGSLMLAQPLTQLWRIDSGVRAAKAGVVEAQRESASIDAKLRLAVEELFVGLIVQSRRTAEKQAALAW